MAKAEKIPLDQAWKNWVDCLKGVDTNSIFQQISTMIWDTAIFRIIIEARKSQIRKNPHNPELNRAYHSFIDRNYFQSQSVCIRRLTDKSYGLTGKKGVYSVSALLNDISIFRPELTREKLFILQEVPFELNNQISFSKIDAFDVEEIHQYFDKISGTTANNRSPNDLIDEKVFLCLKDKFAECKVITDYVDKFVAHSSSPESRSVQNGKQLDLTFQKLWKAHQIIFKTANFISLILFSTTQIALPIPHPSYFFSWDKPLFDKEEINLARKEFEKYRDETSKWTFTNMVEVWDWIKV